MLEVKMGTLDFHQNSPPPAPVASNTQSGGRGGLPPRADAENGQVSPELPRGSTGKDVLTQKIKEEPEPTPGPSSQDPGQTFSQSASEQEQQAFAMDSLGLLPKAKLQPPSEGGGSSTSGAPPGPGGGGGGGAAAAQQSQQPEGNARGGGGASSSSSIIGAGEPGAPAPTSAPATRPPPTKRRARRRATSAGQDPAEALTEMSVRGLNLFRYASVSEGVYRCTECAKADVQKTFKNKYSFQRHAFLYHEGQQRKVFPCPVCTKEFSRPDKMKNHMKTVHDCFMPKDCGFPLGFFTSFP